MRTLTWTSSVCSSLLFLINHIEEEKRGVNWFFCDEWDRVMAVHRCVVLFVWRFFQKHLGYATFFSIDRGRRAHLNEHTSHWYNWRRRIRFVCCLSSIILTEKRILLITRSCCPQAMYKITFANYKLNYASLNSAMSITNRSLTFNSVLSFTPVPLLLSRF